MLYINYKIKYLSLKGSHTIGCGAGSIQLEEEYSVSI